MNSVKLMNFVAGFVFNAILYIYISKLENIGCTCALNTYGNVTKTTIIINFIVLFGLLFFDNPTTVTRLFIFGYSMLSVFYTFIYLYKLKNEKCKCSDGLVRDIYYYYYLLKIILLTFFLFLVSFVILFAKKKSGIAPYIEASLVY